MKTNLKTNLKLCVLARACVRVQVVEGGGPGEELSVASSLSVFARLLLHAPQAFTSLLASTTLNPAAVAAAVGPAQVRGCGELAGGVCVGGMRRWGIAGLNVGVLQHQGRRQHAGAGAGRACRCEGLSGAGMECMRRAHVGCMHCVRHAVSGAAVNGACSECGSSEWGSSEWGMQ